MPTTSDDRRPSWLPRAASAAAALALAAGALALSGWVLDVEAWKGLLPDWRAIRPVTAAEIVLVALALSLSARGAEPSGPARRAARALAVLVGVTAFVSLAGMLLRPAEAGPAGDASRGGSSGLMSTDAAVCLSLLAASIWLSSGRRPTRLGGATALALAALVANIALAAAFTFTSPTEAAYGWSADEGMSIQAAIVLSVCGAGAAALALARGETAWSLGARATAAFALALTLLAVSGLSISGSLSRLRRVDREAADADAVLEAATGVVAAAARAQAAARAFVLTGEESFAARLSAAHADGERSLAALRDLTSRDRDALDRTAALRGQVGSAMTWWAGSVALRRKGVVPLEVQRERSVHGEALMDEVRATYADLEHEGRGAIAAHGSESERLTRRAQRVITVGTATGLGILVAAFFGLNAASAARAEATRGLAASEAQLRTVVENLAEGVAISGMDGRLLHFNRAALSLHGFETLEACRMALPSFAETFTLADADGAALPLERWPLSRVLGGERLRDVETQVHSHRHGWRRTYSYNGDIVRDQGGRPLMALVTMTDITERKRAQRELVRSNQELEQFAYVASHDLQEPLRMVSSFTQLLAERYGDRLDEKGKSFVGYAVDGAVRMQQLINDLLAYSRVSSRARPPEPVDAGAALDGALRNLTAAIAESGAVVTRDPLPTVRADPTQLAQVFQNLVGNAIKFRGAEAPRVHVTARDVDGAWAFSVRDNGIGIDARHVGRLFVVFQRLHTRKEYPGTGIGLALCKRIVERGGGRIWLESEPGKGSTFHFTIPR